MLTDHRSVASHRHERSGRLRPQGEGAGDCIPYLHRVGPEVAAPVARLRAGPGYAILPRACGGMTPARSSTFEGRDLERVALETDGGPAAAQDARAPAMTGSRSAARRRPLRGPFRTNRDAPLPLISAALPISLIPPTLDATRSSSYMNGESSPLNNGDTPRCILSASTRTD